MRLGGAQEEGGSGGIEGDIRETTGSPGGVYLPIGFGRRRGHGRLPGPLGGGVSLRGGLGELGTHAGVFNKETQQIQGEQRASSWCSDGASGSSGGGSGSTHTPEGGGSGGGEEDRTEPIKYTPDKKILVEEIKKQQRRREGKGWKSRAQKKEPKCSFFFKKISNKKSQICSRAVDKRKMEKSPWSLIRCGVQRPSAQMNGLTGADAAPARAGQSARSTQSRGRGLRAGRTMEPRFANDLNISLGPRINVLQINKSVKKIHGSRLPLLKIIMHRSIGLLCL